MGREQRQQQRERAAGVRIQRSQSRSSLSASFEALAGYFPCMNSPEEDEGEHSRGKQEKLAGDIKACNGRGRYM